ncbi:MAG: hypothetical protein M3680_06240 [Myxococcota bacterium]|nr:hypothetical protein [Myxococcota bacterium]
MTTTRSINKVRRAPERGSAMLVTMVIVAALLAGAAVVTSMQMSANRATDLTRTGLSALYCAEAGLTLSRAAVASNYDSWGPALAQSQAALAINTVPAQPAWLGPTVFDHDLDNDGAADLIVYIRDDDDEPGANNTALDTNGKVFIVSRCIKWPDTPKQVEELISYTPAANCYRDQEGGCNQRNNFAR